MDKYGPFANIAAIALALVALFSMLLVKMLGSVKKWTWLTDSPPPFLVKAGPQALAIALMVAAYLTAARSNQGWFIAAAIVCGLLCLISIIRFDRDRRTHVVGVPLVGSNGQPLVDGKGRPLVKNVVIGTESNLSEPAKTHLSEARKEKGGVSLVRFMSGYGDINNPEDLWERNLLARIGTRLTTTLMAIILFAVLTLFLAALLVDITQRAT
ncbi:hypothetical protein GCM10009630_27110 [Kribbella jejuensis]|uniref:Uncharacterized protein n=1 Tax=Kribbella jejuensis TaxID=236068 RepID=A0A542DUD9_9ACTN|nr:hypothetical protein [Kribbella jejuensis]TQJ06731.1 hypothetical protein FB475_6398 [Kribbella jejuensis]